MVCWRAPHRSVRMFVTYAKLAIYLKRNQFSILHCHLLYALGPWVGAISGLRVVTTVHSVAERLGTIALIGLKRSDTVIACSEEVAEGLSRRAAGRRLVVLKNGIKRPQGEARDRNELRQSFGIAPEHYLVVSLGRLIELKSYDVLISAVAAAMHRHAFLRLLVAGDGEMRAELERQVVALGLDGKVRLMGHVSDVDGLLRAADLYVNSSKWEGLPMSLIEAMARGLPMIATNVGGNREIVLDGKTGVLIQPGDVDALSSAIIERIEDPEGSRRMASGALRLFDEEFGIERHCGILASEYRRVAQ
ncbi:MAG: glycosyltransferase family 4 protein [Gammaproteobacteria bacterium]